MKHKKIIEELLWTKPYGEASERISDYIEWYERETFLWACTGFIAATIVGGFYLYLYILATTG